MNAGFPPARSPAAAAPVGQAAPAADEPQQRPPPLHTNVRVLAAIARHLGVDVDAKRLVHDHALDAEPGLQQLIAIAQAQGLAARHVRMRWRQLKRARSVLPALARLANGNAVALIDIADDDSVTVVDPLAPAGGRLTLERKSFEASWQGDVVLIKRAAGSGEERETFGFGWFLRQLVRERRHFRDVIIGAFFVNLLGLAVPIFFQLMVDKVLVHRAVATLQVLSAGVIIAVLFEGMIMFLREYILLHAVRRIDVRISTSTFHHMLSLPATFFSRVSAGVLTKHLQQTGRIREFLTGQVLTTAIDLCFLFVFLGVLVAYSGLLSLVVVGFAVALGVTIGVLLPPFRRRLRELYRAEAARQSTLVESIHGIATIKSLAVEPRRSGDWDRLCASTAERTFSVGTISLTARSLSRVLEQLMTVSIIIVGVFLVFAGELTVGALIAFQMLANRVTGPLVQFISTLHQYQETAIAIEMLGTVMNAEPEQGRAGRPLRPKIVGEIVFDDVTFSYPGQHRPALSDFSVTIPPKTFLGIVGRSGSGKTTMSRLLQGLYSVQSGAVRIDGIDLREIDLAHLRSHIGVVLQEPFLFDATIRENIAMTLPGAGFEAVVRAARVSGAHEFIEELPHRYDTRLEEGGANLSGGQRQRLAIARALIRNPPILILDEATSALDPESEAIIQANLDRIAHDRTLVVISHRLSMVRAADNIVVIDRGEIAESGTHAQLVEADGLYAGMWRRQSGAEDRPKR